MYKGCLYPENCLIRYSPSQPCDRERTRLCCVLLPVVAINAKLELLDHKPLELRVLEIKNPKFY